MRPTKPSSVRRARVGLQHRDRLAAEQCATESVAVIFNGPIAALPIYLQDPSLETFGNGEFVRKVISYLVDLPIFWNAFADAHIQLVLGEEAELGFAWLLLNLLGAPPRSPDVVRIAQEDGER